jgi:para-nitrobenzyl esterase
LANSPAGPICGFSSSLPIQGLGTVSASAFLGIPYARPPVGDLRWHSPQPLTALPQKPYPATQFGSECVQIPFSSTEPVGDENCLFLNVWVPPGASPDAKLPVMVFIHGGAFVFGTGGAGPAPGTPGFGSNGAYDLFDGTYLAATNKVIVVTLNYRLGVFGFFSLETGLTGNNFGLQDQVLALNWVQQNIASFGGDPLKVTIFGESAGAMSVGLLTLSSQSSNLFHAAIMESNPLGLPYKTTAQANAIGKLLSEMMGCKNPEESAQCMMKKNASELGKEAHSPELAIVALGFSIKIANLLAWGPAIDGTLLNNQQPAARGASLPMPMLLGSNSAEGILFETIEQLLPYDAQIAALVGIDNVEKVKQAYPCTAPACSSVAAQVFTDYIFSCANRHLAIQAAGASSPKPVYAYQFTQTPSSNLLQSLGACNDKACHGAELPFVFNTFETKENVGNTADEERLSQTMGGYWTAFGTNQNPNGGGRPNWPLFSGAVNYLTLVQPPVAAADPFAKAAHCDLWESIGYPAPGIGEALQKLLQPATH